MENETNARRIWPYVIVGSAIGGTIAYLSTTESGRRMTRSLTHPEELADCVENARGFVERKARGVTDKVHGVLGRAKEGMEAGQRAFEQAEEEYRTGLQKKIEGKNNEVAANVHRAVDNVSRTAYTFEESILEPIFEIGAIYRGLEKGVRTVFGHPARHRPETQASNMPTPLYSDERVTG